MALEIAKAGWLYRQSTILKRWKRTWFVLYQDGDLRYFESPDHHEPEARIVVRAVCKAIQTAHLVDAVPPEGKSKDCLINLVLKDGELKLCAEDSDDMKAWHIALEEARVIPPANPPPYPGQVVYPMQTREVPPYPVQIGGPREVTQYPIQVGGPSSVVYPQTVQYTYPGPGQVVHTSYGHQVVNHPPGTNVVYVNQDPYYYRRRYDGTDVAMGVVAGAAIGSMMWGPVLWW